MTFTKQPSLARAGVLLLCSIAFVASCLAPRVRAAAAAQESGQEKAPPQGEKPSPRVDITAPARPGTSPTAVVVGSDEDYRIGLKDVLEVTVDKAPELSGSWRVNSNGSFQMNYVGRVMAQGRTTEEVGDFIAERLKGKYLKNPHVTVVVKQYNSRAFFIQGQVRSPGLYFLEGKPNLLELITLAGGLSDSHGAWAFIIRPIKQPAEAAQSQAPDPGAKPADKTDNPADEAPKYDLLKTNINGLLKGSFEQNMMLEPGDIINIPPTDMFFVAGEVKTPGSFQLKEGTTLRQAISMAQGATYKAAGSKTVIFREDPKTSERKEIKVDLPAVMKGKDPDIPLIANDIVIVPNSRMKTIGGTMLSAFGVGLARVPAF
jgi:polysaccharide biosynthesis/export protein